MFFFAPEYLFIFQLDFKVHMQLTCSSLKLKKRTTEILYLLRTTTCQVIIKSGTNIVDLIEFSATHDKHEEMKVWNH